MSQGEHGIDERVLKDREEQAMRMIQEELADLKARHKLLDDECSGLYEKCERYERERNAAFTSLSLAIRMRDTMNQNLTDTQARCTELLEEVRALRARTPRCTELLEEIVR